MDLFQGGILTGEKIKIKNKNCNINPAAAVSHSGDNNISGESENQGSNGGAALNPGLKRRHSSTLFAPKHAGMEHHIYFSRQCRKIRAKSLVFSYTSVKKKIKFYTEILT